MENGKRKAGKWEKARVRFLTQDFRGRRFLKARGRRKFFF
jgi:hypothetical protein